MPEQVVVLVFKRGYYRIIALRGLLEVHWPPGGYAQVGDYVTPAGVKNMITAGHHTLIVAPDAAIRL